MSNLIAPKVTYLHDYQPSAFVIDEVILQFDLYDTHTQVKSLLKIKRHSDSQTKQSDLILHGEHLTLKSISLNNTLLDDHQYVVTPTELRIFEVPDEFHLEIEVEITPHTNLRLSGLYKTGLHFCTQCESHGFRCITYYLDRPDVLARFITIISADKTQYPVLLSNGNLIDQGQLSENRHWVKWQDPTLKPAYLFALVAGNLDVLTDHFTTQSGRVIQLFIYVDQGKLAQASYAMQCIQEAMRWDEEKYGREYDLDIFMLVGVSDFNFGAMENKGLNIFNDRYILAEPQTATDEDFINIKNVIAHEYFHNWSGNRVTVRDWFQITLKEGLTVFRDQQFTAEKTFPVVKRIQEAKNIRNLQFPQDAGPMAHPIYPDSYIEINNFYTVTVYEKGAEVIRMIHTLLGETAFRKAMDLYFDRHDGYPATTRDFVKAMEDSSGEDLSQFWQWYKQSGTPILHVADHYEAQTQTYTLTITQSCPSTPGQPEKKPFHIPVLMGLLDEQGNALSLQLKGEEISAETQLLSVKQATEVFQFVHVPAKPIPSLLRHFSAPVKLHYPFTDQQYLVLLSHDTDLWNRWDAAQQLATRLLLNIITDIQQGKNPVVPTEFLSALATILKTQTLEPALITEILTLPSEVYLLEQLTVADIDVVHQAREWLKKQIATTLKDLWISYYEQEAALKPYTLDVASIAKRRLKNLALSYLTLLDAPHFYQQSLTQFQQANNMTDTMGALLALNHVDCPERVQALAEFSQRWQHDHLVMHKWFSCQAISSLPNTLSVVKALTQHPDFDIKNPNRVRALIGAFCTGNPLHFHQENGEGYVFLADYVLKMDLFNPQLAARIIEPLIHWKKYNATRQALIKAQLIRIINTKPLSNDVYEVVVKSI